MPSGTAMAAGRRPSRCSQARIVRPIVSQYSDVGQQLPQALEDLGHRWERRARDDVEAATAPRGRRARRRGRAPVRRAATPTSPGGWAAVPAPLRWRPWLSSRQCGLAGVASAAVRSARTRRPVSPPVSIFNETSRDLGAARPLLDEPGVQQVEGGDVLQHDGAVHRREERVDVAVADPEVAAHRPEVERVVLVDRRDGVEHDDVGGVVVGAVRPRSAAGRGRPGRSSW